MPRRRTTHGKERKPAAGPRLSWCSRDEGANCTAAAACQRECAYSVYRRRHPHPELEPDPRLALVDEHPPEYYLQQARAQPWAKGVQS